MAVKLSVIIPSVGRDTLNAAVKSCAGADEVIVIKDQSGDHGYAARTRGMAQATGTHLAFMDDDDIYTPGAIDLMRDAACERPVVFRMDHYDHGILWREPEIRFGNVSTQMFLVPNDPSKVGTWAPHVPGLKEPGGDYTFIVGCVERMGDPVWREEIVSVLRPNVRSISVVTPWQGHPELVSDYMEAVSVLTPRDELIVVDDSSQPPLDFASVRLGEPSGFARACNAGLEVASKDAVLFLNNDIKAHSPAWLTQIRASLEPRVLVGAELRNDAHGWVDGTPFPYLDGWCLAGMTGDIRELGGWDETFTEPSYYGDNDLCLRARACGFTLREARETARLLHHKRNQTAGRGDDPQVRRATELNRAVFQARAREALAAAA